MVAASVLRTAVVLLTCLGIVGCFQPLAPTAAQGSAPTADVDAATSSGDIAATDTSAADDGDASDDSEADSGGSDATAPADAADVLDTALPGTDAGTADAPDGNAADGGATDLDTGADAADGGTTDLDAADAGPDGADAGTDAVTPACTPTVEICNGSDDDCDGQTDEAGAETACSVDLPCANALCLAGQCVSLPDAKASGPCDDGNACTKDDACNGGLCFGATQVCLDGIPCTDDGCDVTKGCVFAPTSAPCGDGNACTVSDACQAGACVSGKALACSDGNPCTLDGCDKASGCTFLAAAGACSDGDACTTGDACQGGVCVSGKNSTCDDGNACTKDACDKGACTAPQVTGPCDDGDACTLPGSCNLGKCVLAAVDCNDQDPCTSDSCDKTGGTCKHAAVAGCAKTACSSQTDCKTGKCDAVSHACVGCLVHGDCASGQVCETGACVPGVQCASASQCKATAQVCDASAGMCVDCLAESDCASGKTCLAKTCVAKISCVSDIACPMVCAKALGVCAECNVAADCAGKGWCAADHSCHAPVCVGNACLAGSWFQCAADGSSYAAGKTCDDGNDCTADTCDAVKGCAHAAVADGSACGGGTCKAGGCKGVLQAAGGSAHACAVMLDGTVACWGDNTYGQLGDGTTVAHFSAQVVPGLTGVTMVAAGGYQTCALKGTEVWCWGSNNAGQLGNGQKGGAFGALAPQKVQGLAAAKAVAASNETTCALLADGKVACWGSNNQGEVGTGVAGAWDTSKNNVLAPSTVVGAVNAVALAGGSSHFCAVTTSGGAVCWGNDSSGQIGDGVTSASGDNKKYLVPFAKSVAGLSSVAGVACSSNSTCARKADGGVWCWGNNGGSGSAGGHLGVGSTTDPILAPTQVVGLPAVSDLMAGGVNAWLARDGGKVWAWGGQWQGQLGNGAVLSGMSGPVQVSGIVDATALASRRNEEGACAVRNNGTLWCWGSNRYGVLGQGTSQGSGASTNVLQPGAPAIAKGADALVLDENSRACARLADTSWQCWGELAAPFGSATMTAAALPMPAPFLPAGAKSVALNGSYGCFVKSDGTVWCWGANNYGQLGNGMTNGSSVVTTPVQVLGVSSATSVGLMQESACALGAGGTVKCWGYNSGYQLGQITSGQISSTALTVTAAAGTVALSVRGSHACALDDGGKVRCWGTTGAKPGVASETLPVEISGGPWKAVAAGSSHSCALKTDATLWCWGYNNYGQIGSGSTTSYMSTTQVPGVSGIASVTAGNANTCAIDGAGAVWCWGYNDSGVLGIGSTASPVKTPTKLAKLTTKAAAVAMGNYNTCALGQDGSVTCWGNNGSGAVGDGSAWSTVPVQVLGVP